MKGDGYEAPIAGVPTSDLPDKLRAAMKEVEKHFPEGTGIGLFVFDRGVKGGGFGWIANADRSSMIDALVEWIQIQRGRN